MNPGQNKNTARKTIRMNAVRNSSIRKPPRDIQTPRVLAQGRNFSHGPFPLRNLGAYPLMKCTRVGLERPAFPSLVSRTKPLAILVGPTSFR